MVSKSGMKMFLNQVKRFHGGKSKGTTCVVDRDVTDRSDRVVRLSIRSVYMV